MIEILIRCAWCDRDMGEKEPLDDDSMTPGICQECYQRQFPDVPKSNALRLKFRAVKCFLNGLVPWNFRIIA